MSVPSALKLREMRGKPKKPVKFKVELTLTQLNAIALGLETLIFSALTKRPGVLEAGQEAQDVVKAALKKFSVLDPDGGHLFEAQADRRGRKYACSACAIASVSSPGEICANCRAPGAA